MTSKDSNASPAIRLVRHAQVRQKLDVSEAKLFDMIARGQFPKPFQIIPNGRAVGWLESDVDDWILARKRQSEEGAKC
jgi:prophage regulatory protein